MQKIKNILFKQPLLSLAALCFAIAIASPFVFVDSQVTTTAKNVSSKAEATVTPTVTSEQSQAVQGQTSYIQTTSPTVSTQQTTSATQSPLRPSDSAGQATTPTNQPTYVPAVQTFQVNLSVNGAPMGSVTLDQGANQCDVLTKAKDQGKISQLLMKYDNSLGTNGVYQINGVGKDNTVWWVYKVNGTSPGQGCSYIKANSGDTVEWEYKG